jgi:hypothetical protein
MELFASLLAGPAGFGADSTVFVGLGVPFALVATGLASSHASPQQRLDGGDFDRARPANDPNGCGTHIHAIEAQPDALDHLW